MRTPPLQSIVPLQLDLNLEIPGLAQIHFALIMGVGIRPGMVYKGFVLGGELSGLSGYCLGYLAGMGLGTPPVASWWGDQGLLQVL